MKTKAERILETMKGDKAMTRHVLSILEEAQDEEEMILDVLDIIRKWIDYFLPDVPFSIFY